MPASRSRCSGSASGASSCAARSRDRRRGTSRGSATISLLFFDISVDIDETFGERRADVLPPIAGAAGVARGAREARQLAGDAPRHGPAPRQPARARRPGPARPAPGRHAAGQPAVRPAQPAARQGRQPAAVGHQEGDRVRRCGRRRSPCAVRCASGSPSAQYRNLDDAAKLSAPGVRAARERRRARRGRQPVGDRPGGRHAPSATSRSSSTPRSSGSPDRYFEFWGELFVHFAAGGAVEQVRAVARERAEAAAVRGEGRGQGRRLRRRAPVGQHARSPRLHVRQSRRGDARTCTSAIAADPTLTDSIHIIPASEVSVAA